MSEARISMKRAFLPTANIKFFYQGYGTEASDYIKLVYEPYIKYVKYSLFTTLITLHGNMKESIRILSCIP